MDRSESDLSSADCWALLATASVGRIALSIRALPMIVPVRYRVDDGSVAISLGRPGLPVATVHDAVVAFAVDDIDQGSTTGWMVQMQGRARLATSLASSGSSDPAHIDQVIRLAPATVTGHRFTLESFEHRR
jgi:nitroimidazol reductase NimA-like FMN-containing flavoprotein (pyridoxamine 5'-phosphate oxidase superfamily)